MGTMPGILPDNMCFTVLGAFEGLLVGKFDGLSLGEVDGESVSDYLVKILAGDTGN